MTERFPSRVQITGYGWDESRSSYKVQIGDHERTIAYAWVPLAFRDDDAISEATEIAKRLIEGWNAHPANKTEYQKRQEAIAFEQRQRDNDARLGMAR